MSDRNDELRKQVQKKIEGDLSELDTEAWVDAVQNLDDNGGSGLEALIDHEREKRDHYQP